MSNINNPPMWDEIETITKDIDFSASAEEDVTIDIGGYTKEILRGRIYIDVDPGAGFSQWATITFYNKNAKHGNDVIFRTYHLFVYTELEVATTGSDNEITPDAHEDFTPHGLVVILDTTDEFCRIATVADSLLAEDDPAVHAIDQGVCTVAEFSGFSLYNNESDTDVECRITFGSAQSVSLKMELLVRR